MQIETKFDLRDRVLINSCPSLVASVQRIFVGGNGDHTYEVSWFDFAGCFQEKQFYEWQLSRCQP
jgi:hypothetical protein